MNILLVNHYAGSLEHGMEYRPFYLAREWVREGHRVTVLGASFSHVRTRNPQRSAAIAQEEIQGVRYIWLKTPPYQGNGVRRAINIFSFVGRFYLSQGQLFQRDPPQAVIASSTYPLDIYPAQRLARKVGARLVYEVHDLWPLSLIELGGMSPAHPFIRLLQVAEDFAYQQADRVVSILPHADRHMLAHGMAPHKFVYIPNGILVEEWEGQSGSLPEQHSRTLQKLRSRGAFLVGYAGAHGLANALDNLVEAARLLRHEPVAFLLIGQGPEKQRLQSLAEAQGLENVIFLPPLPRDAIPVFLGEIDAAYIGLKSEPLFRFGVSPNKLMDYMMAARPVIYAIAAGNDMVAESSCGVSVPPDDPQALASAIRDLASLQPAQRAVMGTRGRQYVLARHDYRKLAQAFIQAMSADGAPGSGL